MNKLEYHRIKKDLTQQELADRVGVNRALISRVEHGEHDFKGAVWVLLANTLDCTTDELLGKG